MTTCAQCGATPAEFFSVQGDPVCRRCFAADQQQTANTRARGSVVGDARYADALKASKKALVLGLAVMGAAVAFGAALLAVRGVIYRWNVVVFCAGFVSFARGLMLRRP